MGEGCETGTGKEERLRIVDSVANEERGRVGTGSTAEDREGSAAPEDERAINALGKDRGGLGERRSHRQTARHLAGQARIPSATKRVIPWVSAGSGR